MLTQANPADIAAALTVARENLHVALCALTDGGDDLELAERNWFECEVEAMKRYILGLEVAFYRSLDELKALTFDVPARASSLTAYQRTTARKLFHAVTVQVAKEGLLFKSNRVELRKAARALWQFAQRLAYNDAVTLLCERVATLAIGHCDSDDAQNLACARSKFTAPSETPTADWVAYVRLEQIKHGVREPGPFGRDCA